MAFESHLLDTELGGQLTVAQSKHLANCGWCQERHANVSQHSDPTDEDALLAIARSRIAAGASIKLRDLTKLQPALHELTLDRPTRDDVRTGQIWRLRWEDASELAMVLDIDRWRVTVAPVTIDTAAADEYSVVLAPSATPLGIPLAACISLECVVPLFTFDKLVAPAVESLPKFASEVLSSHAIQTIWRAWRRGGAPPVEVHTGEPLLGGDLDRQGLRNTIYAEFEPLVSAASTLPCDTSRPSTSLLEMIESLDLGLPGLLAASNLGLGVFLRIKRGGRVRASEAPRLARLLNTDVSTVLATNPPLDEGLIVQVSRPGWRFDLRQFAQNYQITEDEARWQLAEMATAAAQLQKSHVTDIGDRDAIDSSAAWEPIVQICLHAAIRNAPTQ